MEENGFTNDYTEEEQYLAMNRRNIYVNCSANYSPNPVQYVHNSCELLFFMEGKGTWWIGDREYPVEKNDILIIGAAEPHRGKFTEFPIVRYGLTLMPSYLQSLPVVNSYMNVFRTHSPMEAAKLKGIPDATFQRIEQILCRLREETVNNGEGRGDMVLALLLELTVELNRFLDLEKQVMEGKNRQISEIRTYIDQHFAEDLSLERLSSLFFLQPNTISKNFTQMFGRSISDYINSVRVSNAVRILEGTRETLPITELAEKAGYSSLNTFLRQFKDRLGMSPLQYRKRFLEYMKQQDISREEFRRQEKPFA